MMKCAFILCVTLQCLMIEDVKGETREFTEKLTYVKFKNPYNVVRKTKSSHSGWIPLGEGEIIYFNSSSTNVTTSHNETNITWNNKTSIMSMEHHVLMIEVAALFRNNLIRVFGYILHRRNMELNSELYTSLYFILSTIKLNQVNVLSIVPCLKEIAFKTSNERFIRIFEEMEKHLPSYLSCAAAFWKDAIKNKDVNMDNILKPISNGPLIVDVLEGMNDDILGKVAVDEKIETPKNTNEQKMLYDFNMNIVQIMRYIQHNKNDIHQLFFGALILFFPRNGIQPDLEESIQIVMEFLKQIEVEKWNSFITDLKTKESENPYYVVREILEKLIKDKSTTVVIKESLQIIINNIADRNPTAINPGFNSIASLVELDISKLDYMLKYIDKVGYPIEVYMAAQRVIYYYLKGYIKHLTLYTHFIPYIYWTVPEILIALLGRILKRQPDLPAEIIDSVGAVYGYLVFTNRYIEFPVTMPDEIRNNPNIIFLGIRSPDIQQVDRQNIDKMIELIISVKLDLIKVLSEMLVYKCATPTVCFAQFLLAIQNLTGMSPKLTVVLPEIKALECFKKQCKIEISPNDPLIPVNMLWEFYNNTQSDTPVTIPPTGSTIEISSSTTTPSTTTTVLTTLTQPTEGPISPPTTLKTTTAAPPTTVAVPEIPDNVTEVPNNTDTATALISVLHKIADDQDSIWVEQIIKVLEKQEFKAHIEKMSFSKKTIIITSIVSVLEMVANTTEQAESTITAFLQTFLKKVQHIEEVLKLITTEKQPTRPVLARLIVAVPAPMDNETEIFKQLSLLLQKEELFTLIVNNLEKESYKNIGSLLKAVLHEEIKLKEKLTAKELESAKYYVDKVQLLGLGQGKILWGVDVDVISQNIKIDDIMDNAIGFDSLTPDNRRSFNRIIFYLRENPGILQTWDKWIYYTKCGDFTKALFYLLITQASTPADVKASINRLTPLINYDKKGEKPTFGEEQ